MLAALMFRVLRQLKLNAHRRLDEAQYRLLSFVCKYNAVKCPHSHAFVLTSMKTYHNKSLCIWNIWLVYGMNNWGTMVWVPAGASNLLPLQSAQRSFEPQPALC